MIIIAYLSDTVKWAADVIQNNCPLGNYYNLTNKKRCSEILLLSKSLMSVTLGLVCFWIWLLVSYACL